MDTVTPPQRRQSRGGQQRRGRTQRRERGEHFDDVTKRHLDHFRDDDHDRPLNRDEMTNWEEL